MDTLRADNRGLPAPMSHMASLPWLQPRRIGVFRALMLGDMLCATPALRALRSAWPEAHITLIGLPWAAGLAQRLASIDDFLAFPGWPGLPELPAPAPEQMRSFMGQIRRRHFDLAIQLHGSGQLTNALVASFGAECNAGFGDEKTGFPAADASRFVPWPERGNEILRLLQLTDHLGLPRRGVELDLPLTLEDYRRADALVSRKKPYAIVHAGSQLPSRRWPPQRFAAVADRLAATGLTVVLTGTASEKLLVDSVASAMAHRPLDLCGETDLWTLGALLASAQVLLCNDTGLSHMAAALGVPSVITACGSEIERWAPLNRHKHRVLSHEVACRPCAHRECPLDHQCAKGLPVKLVTEAVIQMANGEVA